MLVVVSGRSGLSVDGRDGIQRLMKEVQTGAAKFAAILVYDVSRWGRFQDAEEAAYYEHLCSRAGIRVHYCGEQFDNDGSIGSILLKSAKRVMAGEYRNSQYAIKRGFAREAPDKRSRIEAIQRAGCRLRPSIHRTPWATSIRQRITK
jgi:DNA invertase Pin-like site-specific DNA recombinase